MAPETAYVVDFDGTITTRDITTELGLFFGGSEFIKIDQSYQAKEIPIKLWLQAEAALLPVDLKILKEKALEWAEIRPGFVEFLEVAEERNNPVIVASDGLGFYIEPILERFGVLEKINMIYRNDTLINQEGRLEISNPHAHPICIVCGNCKAKIVVQQKTAGRPVVYIGDGSNDRFGASWADLIFARDELAENCHRYNLSYSPWDTFYDIINLKEPELHDSAKQSLCCPLGSGIKVRTDGEVNQ